MAQAAEEVQQAEHPQTVEITVNRKPVSVVGHKQTGLQIKKAAIDQGVKIELSFQLSEHRGHHQTHIIGDTDEVTVHKGSEFFAVAGDDNS